MLNFDVNSMTLKTIIIRVTLENNHTHHFPSFFNDVTRLKEIFSCHSDVTIVGADFRRRFDGSGAWKANLERLFLPFGVHQTT